MSENKYGLDLEIGDLWYMPFWQTTTFYLIMGIAGFLLLVVFVWWYKTRSKQHVSKDPLEKLIADIRHLELGMDDLDCQVFYLELIGYVKQFAKYRYKLDISGKTDVEIKKILKENKLDAELQNLILHLLDSSEKIRFASDSSSRGQMENDLQRVLDIVQRNLSKSNLALGQNGKFKDVVK